MSENYTVAVPDRIIQKAINDAVTGAFDGWNGLATRAIASQVQECVASIDWRPLIREAIDKRSALVVEDTTEDYIRKNVQKIIKEMRARGELLPAELFKEEA